MAGTLKGKIENWVDPIVEYLFPGMQGRQVFTLYVVIPVAIGAVLGWYRAGYAADYPLVVSLFDWIANFFTLWIAFDLGSRLAAFLFRAWATPLWLILIFGGVAGVAVSRPLRSFVRSVAGDLAPEAQQDISFPAGMLWQEFVFAYAGIIAMPILLWVVTNYVFANGLGVPRYGYVSPKSAAGRLRDAEKQEQSGVITPTPIPEFTKRLDGEQGAKIWALQAEDHYLRVYTDTREELIRYRFSDAVNEVKELPGLQVHRSFWINTQAIDSIKRSGRSYEIILKTGLSVPVSRSYRFAVKEAGLLTRFPSRPSPLFSNDQIAPSVAK